MNVKLPGYILLIFFLIIIPGCSLAEAVFKLGVWFTLIGILVVIVLLILIFRSVSYKPEEGTDNRQLRQVR